jgi:hypothetical protein
MRGRVLIDTRSFLTQRIVYVAFASSWRIGDSDETGDSADAVRARFGIGLRLTNYEIGSHLLYFQLGTVCPRTCSLMV